MPLLRARLAAALPWVALAVYAALVLHSAPGASVLAGVFAAVGVVHALTPPSTGVDRWWLAVEAASAALGALLATVSVYALAVVAFLFSLMATEEAKLGTE